jgi:heme-degrading monooxygenase HmoA
MHARMTRFKGDPSNVDEATQGYREALAQFAEMDGNRGAALFVDRDSGDVIGMTLWEDAESMVAGRDRAAQLRENAAEQQHADIASVDEFEVAVWEPQG